MVLPLTSIFRYQFFRFRYFLSILHHFSVFGKTMENTREYRHIDLVETEAMADRLTKQPSYRAHHVFHDNLIAVERYQTSVKMDKPIYTGKLTR